MDLCSSISNNSIVLLDMALIMLRRIALCILLFFPSFVNHRNIGPILDIRENIPRSHSEVSLIVSIRGQMKNHDPATHPSMASMASVIPSHSPLMDVAISSDSILDKFYPRSQSKLAMLQHTNVQQKKRNKDQDFPARHAGFPKGMPRPFNHPPCIHSG